MMEASNLTVQITKTVLGELETNVDEVLAFISERVQDYTVEKYIGKVDIAKKDRAELNKADTRMKDIAKEIQEKFLSPILPTIEKLKEGRALIAETSKTVDDIIKSVEAAEDEIKTKQIEQYYEIKKFDLVPLSRIWDKKWLNKTTATRKVFEEIDAKIAEIHDNIKTLETLEDSDVLKPLYLDTLDLGSALRKGKDLKDYREKLAREAKERAEREAREEYQKQNIDLAKDEKKAEVVSTIAAMAAQAAGDEPEDTDTVMSYTLKFTAKKSKLFALRQYMADNGIKYEKIEGAI